MHRILGRAAIGAVVLGAACAITNLHGADQKAAEAAAANPVDLFAGMESGDLQVKFIPKNDHEASLIVQNNTNQPISLKLPDAFVGVPVLAQGAVGGGNSTRNRSSSSGQNNQNQSVGGGGGGLGGGGFGGGGGFNIAPEAVQRIKLPVVCLEHGKKDPAAQVAYEIRPIETFSNDDRLVATLEMLGSGKLDQQAAQAAAWHFANGMSWDELANKKIHHVIGNRPDEPYFSQAQIRMAMQIASQAEVMAKDHPSVAKDDSKAKGDSKAKDLKSPNDNFSTSSDSDAGFAPTTMPASK